MWFFRCVQIIRPPFNSGAFIPPRAFIFFCSRLTPTPPPLPPSHPYFPLTQPLSLKESNPSLVASLAALVLSDSGSEITAENITSVVEASGNKVPAYYAPLFASMIEKAGGVEKFLAGPSAGGAAPSGGAAPAAGGAAPAAKAPEKPKEEEVDALDGGMDMFGGGGGKTGDY